MFIKQHYALVFVIVALIVGFIAGVLALDSHTCKNAIVQERIITTEQVDDNTSKEVTYYQVRCVGDSDIEFRIQTDKDYPLNSNIKKTWVKDGK